MPPIFLRILQILVWIIVAALIFYIVIWVLGLIGILIPHRIQTLILILLVLAAAIGGFTGKSQRK